MVDAEGLKLLVKALAFLDIFAHLRVFALARGRENILRSFLGRRDLLPVRFCHRFRLLSGVIWVLNEGVDVLDIGSVEVVDKGGHNCT